MVHRAALHQFRDHHPGTPFGDADAQIRRLLYDLLRHPENARSSRNPGTGEWALNSVRPYGFSILISSDGSAVTAYRTKHAERTYAQIKAGVQTRVGTPSNARPGRIGKRLAAKVRDGLMREDEARDLAQENGQKALAGFERHLARMQSGTPSASEVSTKPR